MLSTFFEDNGGNPVGAWIVVISKCKDGGSDHGWVDVDGSKGGLRTRALEVEIASIGLGRVLAERLAEEVSKEISYYTRVGR